MNHQLEDAVPHQAVVQGGGTAPSLQPGPCLREKRQGVSKTSCCLNWDSVGTTCFLLHRVQSLILTFTIAKCISLFNVSTSQSCFKAYLSIHAVLQASLILHL